MSLSTRSQAPVGISREAVVATALELMDEHGVDWLTMRRLGAALGVTGAAVQWHVGTKKRLWEAAAELVMSQIELSGTSDLPWPDRVRAFIGDARRQLLRHPSLPALTSRVLPQSVSSWAEQAFDIMRDAGFDAERAATYARIMIWHTTGQAMIESNVQTSTPVAEPAGGGGSRYRLRPEFVNTDRDDVRAMAEGDLEEQHELTTEMFVAGVRAALDSP